MLRHGLRFEKRHRTEAPDIIVTDHVAIAHAEHHMVVARIGIVIVIKCARRLGVTRGLMQDREASGHAEMHREAQPAFRFHDDVLGAAAEAGHALVQKPLYKSVSKGKRKSGRLSVTASNEAPSMAGTRPRRIISTSGSRHALKLAAIGPLGKPVRAAFFSFARYPIAVRYPSRESPEAIASRAVRYQSEVAQYSTANNVPLQL